MCMMRQRFANMTKYEVYEVFLKLFLKVSIEIEVTFDDIILGHSYCYNSLQVIGQVLFQCPTKKNFMKIIA